MNSILVAPGRRDDWRSRRLPILAAAAFMAAALGAACGDRIASLIEDLSSGDDQVCVSAAKTLGAMGPEAAVAAPAMFDVVVKQRRASGRTCWTTAARELPKLGPAAATVLLTALGDTRTEDAGHVLGGMGASALPVLSKALADPKTVDGAVDVIGVLGATAAPALGDLRDARKNGRLTERRFLASISWFRSEQTVPDFAAALRSADVEVRWMAVRALGTFAARSPQAVKALAFALQDSTAEIRNDALDALSRAGPAAKPAVPAVRQAASRRLVSPRLAQMAIARIEPR